MSKSVLMTGTLGLALAALVSAPAMARENDARDREMGRVVEELSNPRNQRAAGAAMGALAEMLLSMKTAPLAKAMDAMGNRDAARAIPRHGTLADMAGPEARALPREAERRVPQMMGAMAGMAGVMQAMLPQLEEMAARMKDVLPERIGDRPPPPVAGDEDVPEAE
jgi:hypothetical protein